MAKIKPVILTGIVWQFTPTGAIVQIDVDWPSTVDMFFSLAPPITWPRMVRQRGVLIECGRNFHFELFRVFEPKEEQPCFRLTYHVDGWTWCMDAWFYFSIHPANYSNISTSIIFHVHHPGPLLPFFEHWDATITDYYPWVPTTFATSRVSVRTSALEIATEGMGWGPNWGYVTLDEGVPGSPLPMTLPRWMITHTQAGLLRDPYLAYTELRFELIFGRRYRLRFCTEWPFGDQEYAHVFNRRYKKIAYGFVAIDLFAEWVKMRDHFGLPAWTPIPVVDQITVRAEISGSPIGYDAIFRQAFLGLVETMPANWPWLHLV